MGGLGFEPAALGSQGGAFGLEGCRVPAASFRSLASPPRALRWASTADRAVFVFPRRATSSIALSIRPRRRSRIAMVWAATWIRDVLKVMAELNDDGGGVKGCTSLTRPTWLADRQNVSSCRRMRPIDAQR